MKEITLITLTITAFIAGCASGSPARGWSPKPESTTARAKVGARFIDFTFQDQDGTSRSLGQLLGDYTVLAFTKCESDTHQPVVDRLETIVANNRDLSNVKVTGVDVHWSEIGCQDHEHCHLINAQGDLNSICDASGDVQRVYGVAGKDWLFVIGPDKTIVDSQPADKSAKVNRRLRTNVHELSRRRASEEFDFQDRG